MGKHENIWNIVECTCRILGVSTATGKIIYIYISNLKKKLFTPISESARLKTLRIALKANDRFKVRLECLKLCQIIKPSFF